MDIVVDSSALLAALLDEPERQRMIELTSGHSLIGPGCIPWEIGNAFSAMLKRRRVVIEAARAAVAIFEAVPIRYVGIDMVEAVAIADRLGIYAYDAYYLACAMRQHAPLLTLDRSLMGSARGLGVQVMEV